MFRNCLVAMRPKSTLTDLPTTHDVITHLHNKFVKWLAQLKKDVEVSEFYSDESRDLPIFYK